MGSLNRVPASAGIKVGKSPLPVQETLCDQLWHVTSRSGVVISSMNCYVLTFTFLPFINKTTTPCFNYIIVVVHLYKNLNGSHYGKTTNRETYIRVVPKIGRRWSHYGNPDKIYSVIKTFYVLNSKWGVVMHMWNSSAMLPVIGISVWKFETAIFFK